MSFLSEQSVDSWDTRRQAVQLVRIGRELADLADSDPRIVTGSADLKYATLISEFEVRHPERFFQFGIAERNMFGAAAPDSNLRADSVRLHLREFRRPAGV